MLDIAHVGSHHADCPIQKIITIPEFRSRPDDAFAIIFGTFGSQGFPATSSLAFRRILATDIIPRVEMKFPQQELELLWHVTFHPKELGY